MKIFIDNGHGSNTSGKCSPDQRIREYRYCREIAKEVVARLRARGYDAIQLVPEEYDVERPIRCDRANKFGKNSIFISIHVNAAGSDKQWHNAGGWCAYTSKGKTKADVLATYLYESAKKHLAKYAQMMEEGKKTGIYSKAQRAIRTDYSDGDADYEENFTVLHRTIMPAVLTENLFQDNESDANYLLSPEGREAIISLHVEGIINYIKSLG